MVLILLEVAIVFAFGLIGIAAAFRFGNGEAVQGLFPVLFIFLFLSTMALPSDLIEQDWFRAIATYNPVSYLFDGVRSLFYGGLSTLQRQSAQVRADEAGTSGDEYAHDLPLRGWPRRSATPVMTCGRTSILHGAVDRDDPLTPRKRMTVAPWGA